jgi:hypothetical protein
MDQAEFESKIASALEAQNKELRRIAKALEELLEKGITTYTTPGEL